MTRVRERAFIYNGVRKIIRAYNQVIPEDFVTNLAKAEAASFKMVKVSLNEYAQRVKDTIADLKMEV